MSNSGIEHFGAVDEVTEEDINRTFNINVKSQFFVAQQAYKHMENHGRLILMSSISAQKVMRFSDICDTLYYGVFIS